MKSSAQTIQEYRDTLTINKIGEANHKKFCKIGAQAVARYLKLHTDQEVIWCMTLARVADVAAREAGMSDIPSKTTCKFRAVALFESGADYHKVYPPGTRYWKTENTGGYPWYGVINPHFTGQRTPRIDLEARTDRPPYSDDTE